MASVTNISSFGYNINISIRRSAITLLELLVVTSIIGVLASLGMAAIQRARMAAITLSCRHQLRQCSLAMHQYHDSLNAFPPGHRSLLNRDGMPFTGWTLELLPWLDQQALSNQARMAFRRVRLPFATPPHTLDTPVTVFSCPADSRTLEAGISKRTFKRVAFTSYLGVSGIISTTKNGVLYQDSRTRISEIMDGSSFTLLLGERPPSADLQFGWWYAGIGQRLTGSGDLILGVEEPNLLPVVAGSPCGPGTYYFKPSFFQDPCGLFHFWSPHGDGGSFAFADGSVRWISYSARSQLKALASRSGGEETPLGY